MDIAAEPGGLEGDRTGPAEAVADPRAMAEAHDPELLDQLRKAPGRRPEVVVHLVPDVAVKDGFIDLLGAKAIGQLFCVRHLPESSELRSSTQLLHRRPLDTNDISVGCSIRPGRNLTP